MITSRLGVVVTRLLAAAFWLGVGRIADIAVVRRTGDSTWQLRVTVESYLYYYRGAGHRVEEHDDTGL
jgi:hypothetical protein